MNTIARIYTDFDENFGIPRQSGLADQLKGEIVFEEEYRSIHAFRGLEEFSHIWILWRFDHETSDDIDSDGWTPNDTEKEGIKREGARRMWKPTVRPPRLGGNERMGVFATRSPFRPNPIGLSCVRLETIRFERKRGPVLSVSGIDMRNGTEIYDIKPYLPYVDAHPEAKGGFAEAVADCRLDVEFPEELLNKLPEDKAAAAIQILSQDPRPGYQHASERVYGISFSGFNLRFQVTGGVLRVIAVE